MPERLRCGIAGAILEAPVPEKTKARFIEPMLQRTLNWVHLASRFPVRVRVENPPPKLFRVSESAVVVIRGR